ncbi:asparagine synthase C-terminal domain-containing protein [Ruania suaedae]|uniref:asparagine synthase-related protein n=1 Tax=Ruania suaedae TaxID=2897774 RepID=UPI001E28D5B0|nr:asparagine synthase C-terminal domain-containing protein [Ruania suaedae]UFU02401.1 asparagine synthase C-terminal domain-containing protein [Ruania suaedae]
MSGRTHVGEAGMSYQRLTARERAVAAPLGAMPPSREVRRADGRLSTRAALEQAVAGALGAGPCYVLFSGGRDSSLVLALATRAARLVGAPLPIPVTAVYPGDERADESSWQALVLGHLGLTERIVLPVTDQRSTLGDLATRHLRRRGLVWPEAVHTQPLFFEQLDPGTILTGEGGDIFVEGRRITPLHLLVHGGRRRPSGALVRAAAMSLAPGALLRRQVRRRWADPDLLPWLRPAAREILAADEAALRGPLRWDASCWADFDQRATRLGLDNAVVSAAEYGLRMRHPLAEAPVVGALAREGGAWGFRGRTSLFRRLGSDLLPDEVLARRSKAAFNSSRWGERERAFAREFQPGGFDPDFVDEERLRAEWLSPRPHPASFFLAQMAWLHQAGVGPGSDRSQAAAEPVRPSVPRPGWARREGPRGPGRRGAAR